MIYYVWNVCFVIAIVLLSDEFVLVVGSSNGGGNSYRRLKPNHNNNNHHHQNGDNASCCFVPSAVPTAHEFTKPTPSPTKDRSNDDGDNKTLKSITNIVGLQNLGNTCYLNAQIQCVYHIPLVRNMIIGKLENGSRSREDSPSSLSSSSPANDGLRQLFIDMNESQLGRAVTTTSLCQLLDIPVFEQQDTQEFWKLLLPALQLPNVMDLYTGTYENYILALDGSKRERRFLETFLDISLDIINPSTTEEDAITTTDTASTSIMDSLQQQFNHPELLSVDAGNGWRPSSDAPEKVDAHKGYQLKRRGLPSILQLHLKRFRFDWNTETTNKLNQAVTFPSTLDLNTVVASDDDDSIDIDHDDCIYELQSVIVHVGEYQSGHYYSYVRPNVRSDDWYRFNDEIHTRVRFTDVVNDAYGGLVSTTPRHSNQTVKQKVNDDGKKGNRIFRFFRGIFGMDGINVNGYGFGGPKSNAYVLQYVRKTDIPKLYDAVTD